MGGRTAGELPGRRAGAGPFVLRVFLSLLQGDLRGPFQQNMHQLFRGALSGSGSLLSVGIRAEGGLVMAAGPGGARLVLLLSLGLQLRPGCRLQGGDLPSPAASCSPVHSAVGLSFPAGRPLSDPGVSSEHSLCKDTAVPRTAVPHLLEPGVPYLWDKDPPPAPPQGAGIQPPPGTDSSPCSCKDTLGTALSCRS